MTPLEIGFVTTIIVVFILFAAVLAWGWYQTKHLPKP